MDPISMTLAVVPLAMGCGKICNRIRNFKARFVDAPETLSSLDADCSSMKVALTQIQTIMRDMPRRSVLQPQDYMLKDAVNKVIIACTNTVSVLDEEIEELTRDGDELEIMDRIQFCFNEKHLKELSSQLQGHQSSLSFLMNILKTISDFESFNLLQQQNDMLKRLLERSQRSRRAKPTHRRPTSGQMLDVQDTQSVIEYQHSVLSSEYLSARDDASDTLVERLSPLPEERKDFAATSPRLSSRVSSSSRSETHSVRMPSTSRGSVSTLEADELIYGAVRDWAQPDTFRNPRASPAMRPFSTATDRTLISPTPDQGEETFMHEACEKGNLVMIKALLENNANPYAVYADSRRASVNPIQKASRKSSLRSIIKPSFKSKSQPQQAEASWVTPLLIASGAGHVDVVKLLLGYRADPDYGTRLGMLPGSIGKKNEQAINKNPTALFEASEAGHVDVVRILLQHGAGVQARAGEFLMTPLHIAAANGHMLVVETIMRNWGPSNIRDHSSMKERDRFFMNHVGKDFKLQPPVLLPSDEQGPDIEARDTELRTPVLLAAAGGHLDVLRFLVSKKADIRAIDKQNKGILLLAVESGSYDVVQFLLEHGAATSFPLVSQSLGVISPRGTSHLYTASKVPEHPIQLAVEKGHTEVAKLLLDHIREDVANNFRTRPLSVTESSLKSLLLSTPLQIAVFNGNLEMVRILLDSKANVNCQTVNAMRCTSLHIAAVLGYDEIVKILLERGADIQIKDSNNKTAFDVARSGSVRDLLESYASVGGLLTPRSSTSHLKSPNTGGERVIIGYRNEPNGVYGGVRRIPIYQT